jgi:hypothetical protein
VEQDGYTLDKRRRPTPHQNDLPDLSVKYGLHFADMFSSCYPPAFIDDDTKLQWSNIEPERQAYHYAQPAVAQAVLDAGEQTTDVTCFKTTLARPLLTLPKHWEIQVDQLDEQWTLLPGRYQPYSARSSRPGYPPDYPARSAPRSLRAERHTGWETQQNAVQIFSLPGVKDCSTLVQWYRERLQRLRVLDRQGQINARQHLKSLRLLTLICLGLKEHFSHTSSL